MSAVPIAEWVDHIAFASKSEIQAALTLAKSNAHDFAISGSDRVIWRDIVSLLNKQLKRFD